MRTRENSVVISLRIEKELQQEFNALSQELGILSARKLREAFISELEKMREEATAKRVTHGMVAWQEEWSSHNEQG